MKERAPPVVEARTPVKERSPVVEDVQYDWNGPLPGFLSKSAV